MRLGLKELVLLAGALVLDSLQGFVLFNAALCAVPSITGPGIIITAICAAALIAYSSLGVIFTLAWGAFSYYLTGRRLFLGVGVLESVPILNSLPLFTASAAYHILTR